MEFIFAKAMLRTFVHSHFIWEIPNTGYSNYLTIFTKYSKYKQIFCCPLVNLMSVTLFCNFFINSIFIFVCFLSPSFVYIYISYSFVIFYEHNQLLVLNIFFLEKKCCFFQYRWPTCNQYFKTFSFICFFLLFSSIICRKKSWSKVFKKLTL